MSTRTLMWVMMAISLLLGCEARAIYNPEAGRWLSRDPLQEQAGLNLYGYVGNDPINQLDLFGLSQADVARMYGVMRMSVNRMNANGERLYNDWRENVWVWGDPKLPPLFNGKRMGCSWQSDTLFGDLELSRTTGPYSEPPKYRNAYDDDWTFKQKSILFPPHKWVEARSSNPADPIVTLDPFFNTKKTEYGSKDGTFPYVGSNVNAYPATVSGDRPPRFPIY